MKLAIIAVGNLREKHFLDACAEYRKRMGVMQPVEVVEVPEEAIADEGSPTLVEKALEKEAQRILGFLRPGDTAIALTPEGVMVDSVHFAKVIDPSANPDHKRMVFIIGSSHGLGRTVYDKCDRKLSLSPMTYPHQLARVMLLEQLYRGQMILRGRAYHK